jgi:hypothetical protein
MVGGIRRIEIACAADVEVDDGLVMALLAAVKDQEAATERVVLLTGEIAKRRGVALLVE